MGTGMNLLMTALPYTLIAGGGWMIWSGAAIWIAGAGRGRGSTGRLLEMVVGFRQAIVGMGVLGFGVWLISRETWVLVLSLAVVAEEVFETGTIIKALRADARRNPVNRPAPETAPPR